MRSHRNALFVVIAIMVCLQSGADGFTAPGSRSRSLLGQSIDSRPSSKTCTFPLAPRHVPVLSAMRGDDEKEPKKNNKKINGLQSSGLPISSFLLVWIAARSLRQLFLPTEIAGLFDVDGPPIDYIATAFDIFFVGFGAQNILQQSGLLGKQNGRSLTDDGTGSSPPSLADLECRVTLDVGRERGTGMDKDWAASGARLLLPVNIRFTNEENDLGFPGEESLGGRFCYRLEVLDDCVSFVGAKGVVNVEVGGGCWATLPITERKADNGEAKLRFFLDFPKGAQRNDVTLPPGRVFFSGVCFGQAGDAPLDLGESLVKGPGDVGILTEGGMTIKRNNIMNFYGALGDSNLRLGRFKVDKVKILREVCVVD